jgi:hypothetical protein
MTKRTTLTFTLFIMLVLAVSVTLAQDAPETEVQFIELAGFASERDAEISSLAWYGDNLLLVTENPFIYVEGSYADDIPGARAYSGMFFKLHKDDILAYLAADEPAPLEPVPVPIISPDIRGAVSGFVVSFDGFEGAAFVDDSVYLLIEADTTDEDDPTMRAFLVGGTVTGDLDTITLDLENFASIPRQTDFNNMSYESLFVAGDRLVAVYEANGAGVNMEPAAYAVDFDLSSVEPILFPNVEYRVTDATALDADGMFWAVNYFFVGEDFLAADEDPLFDQWGMGASQAEFDGFERLVAFQYGEDGITLVDTAPIQLLMTEESSGRNWEGIARLDDAGLLVVTDRFPVTLLGFVPFE